MCRTVFAVMKSVRVRTAIGCTASARDSAASSGPGQRAPQALFSPSAAAQLIRARKPFFSFGHVWVELALWVSLPMGRERGFA